MEATNILTKEQILTIVENNPLYFGNDNNGIPKVNYLIKINSSLLLRNLIVKRID